MDSTEANQRRLLAPCLNHANPRTYNCVGIMPKHWFLKLVILLTRDALTTKNKQDTNQHLRRGGL